MANKAAYRLTTPLAIGAFFSRWPSGSLGGFNSQIPNQHANNIRALGTGRCSPTVYANCVPTPWHARMHARFTLGFYEHLPYEDLGFTPNANLHLDHALHIDPENDERVRYFDSVEHMRADRHTTTTLGRYLTKFYDDTYSDVEIRDIAACFTAKTTRTQLKFHISARDIVDAYTHGPRSCMSHGARHFSSGTHPTAVYGDSDLQLAVLYDPAQRITARALVWGSERVYGRIYGDSYRMREKLRAAGYKHGSFDGAEIRKLHLDDDDYLMPYVDNFNENDDTSAAGGMWLEECHDHFILRQRSSSGTIARAETTGGSVTLQGLRECRDCGVRMREDDAALEYYDDLVCSDCARGYMFVNTGAHNEWVALDTETVTFDVDRTRFTTVPDRIELSLFAYESTDARIEACTTARDTTTVWLRDDNDIYVPDQTVRTCDTWTSDILTIGDVTLPREDVFHTTPRLLVRSGVPGTFNVVRRHVHPRHRDTLIAAGCVCVSAVNELIAPTNSEQAISA